MKTYPTIKGGAIPPGITQSSISAYIVQAAKNRGIDQFASREIVLEGFRLAAAAIADGVVVAIPTIGKLYGSTKQGRKYVGKGPLAGHTINVAPKNTVKFKASPALVRRVNEGRETHLTPEQQKILLDLMTAARARQAEFRRNKEKAQPDA